MSPGDTITIPPDSHLLAGLHATRGDVVATGDPSTQALEERVARLTGKEEGMFVLSGTMGNQLAVRTHLKGPPGSVMMDVRSHVFVYEAGGMAVLSQALAHPLTPKNGSHLTLTSDILPSLVLGSDIHSSPTRLICLENTLNGQIFPQAEVVKISEKARSEGVGMHLDGARVWEAAAKRMEMEGLEGEESLREVLTDLCEPFDSVSLCLSKGLGAPIGSILVGSSEFITRAKWFRKMIGGGIRQSGAIAAAASLSITEHFPKLANTHRLARKIDDAVVGEMGGKMLTPTETNMVWLDLDSLNIPLLELQERAERELGIVVQSARLVVHHQIEEEAVDDLIGLLRTMREEWRDKEGVSNDSRFRYEDRRKSTNA